MRKYFKKNCLLFSTKPASNVAYVVTSSRICVFPKRFYMINKCLPFSTKHETHVACRAWCYVTKNWSTEMPAVHSPSAFGESLGWELPEMRLGECDSLHSCWELSIHERREQGECVQTRARIRHVLVLLVFFFQNLFFVLNFGFFFQNSNLFFRKLRPSRMYLSPISVRWVCRWFWRATRGDSQARHETLWLVHHRPLKSETLTRGETRTPTLHERIQGETSVPIYILALALSQVPSERVYSQQKIYLKARLHLGWSTKSTSWSNYEGCLKSFVSLIITWQRKEILMWNKEKYVLEIIFYFST